METNTPNLSPERALAIKNNKTVINRNLYLFKRSTDIRRLSRLSMLYSRQTRMSTLRSIIYF